MLVHSSVAAFDAERMRQFYKRGVGGILGKRPRLLQGEKFLARTRKQVNVRNNRSIKIDCVFAGPHRPLLLCEEPEQTQGYPAAAIGATANVRFWHTADVPVAPANVRFWKVSKWTLVARRADAGGALLAHRISRRASPPILR